MRLSVCVSVLMVQKWRAGKERVSGEHQRLEILSHAISNASLFISPKASRSNLTGPAVREREGAEKVSRRNKQREREREGANGTNGERKLD